MGVRLDLLYSSYKNRLRHRYFPVAYGKLSDGIPVKNGATNFIFEHDFTFDIQVQFSRTIKTSLRGSVKMFLMKL